MTYPVDPHTQPRIVPLVPKSSEDAVRTLAELLEDAKRGEITSVTGIAWLHGDEYKRFGSEIGDRHKMAGVLMELAIVRVIED